MNPYKLPTRKTFVAQLLGELAIGNMTSEHERDIITDVDRWDTRRAEEAAAVTYELLVARRGSSEEALLGANESGEIWLHHLHAHVDAGHITDTVRLCHVYAWSKAKGKARR